MLWRPHPFVVFVVLSYECNQCSILAWWNIVFIARVKIIEIMLQPDKFLRSDWLQAVVFSSA